MSGETLTSAFQYAFIRFDTFNYFFSTVLSCPIASNRFFDLILLFRRCWFKCFFCFTVLACFKNLDIKMFYLFLFWSIIKTDKVVYFKTNSETSQGNVSVRFSSMSCLLDPAMKSLDLFLSLCVPCPLFISHGLLRSSGLFHHFALFI